MQDIRCEKCGKLLYRLVPDQEHFITRPQPVRDIELSETLIAETLNNEKYLIECKCPRCGTVNTNKESVK